MLIQPNAEHPVPATIAIVIRSGQVLLVRLANPPDAGLWGFPGGKIEYGETVRRAALRELAEETGLSAEVLGVFNAVDAFDRDASGSLHRHFVLIAVLCRWKAGEPVAGDDALEARWFDLDGLANGAVPLSHNVAEIAAEATALMEAISS